MSTENQLIEQHIREYESRMEHIDELMERARMGIEDGPEHEGPRTELDQILRDREKLDTLYDELKLTTTEDWRKEEIVKSGPMGLWDAIAQQLEKLVERLER